MRFVYDDGGREESILGGHGYTVGFLKSVGDCACRAISIATQQSYFEVYAALAHREQYERRRQRPDSGIYNSLIRRYMTELKWVRTLCQSFGRINLKKFEDLPQVGRIVVVTSKHCCALIDGVLHDTWDCSEKSYLIHSYWRKAD